MEHSGVPFLDGESCAGWESWQTWIGALCTAAKGLWVPLCPRILPYCRQMLRQLKRRLAAKQLLTQQ